MLCVKLITEGSRFVISINSLPFCLKRSDIWPSMVIVTILEIEGTAKLHDQLIISNYSCSLVLIHNTHNIIQMCALILLCFDVCCYKHPFSFTPSSSVKQHYLGQSYFAELYSDMIVWQLCSNRFVADSHLLQVTE